MPDAARADQDPDVSLRIPGDRLRDRLVEPVRAVASDAILDLRPAGIATLAVDPARVAVIAARVQSDYSDGSGATVGVPLHQLAAALDDLPIDDLPVTIEAADAADAPLVIHAGDNTATVPTVAEHAIRDRPPVPTPDYTARTRLPGWKLGPALVGVGTAAENRIRVSAGAGSLLLEGDEKTGRYGRREYPHRWRLDADQPGTGRALYSADYLKPVADAISWQSPVELEFGTDAPIHLVGETVEYWQAPRITTDPGEEDAEDA